MTFTDHSDQVPGVVRTELRRGIVAMLPLLAGVVPFALAFAISSRIAGMTPLETQALSMILFAGSAQLATISLVADGASVSVIVLTVLLLNLRHVLYGLSLARRFAPSARMPRSLLAFVLVDESYGLTIRDLLTGGPGRRHDAFLLGAGAALYVTFALATAAGTVLGAFLPDPAKLGLDFVFPLSFLALLIPLLRSRLDAVVAVVAGTVALAFGRIIDGGTAVLLATVVAALLGVAAERRAPNEVV